MNAAFSRFSNAVSHATGKPIAFIAALAIVCSWAISGPFFGFSEVWQLVINTGTTIITFLMIFVLQNSQNRDGEALQAKLDELILTSKRAENKFIGIERLDERELRDLHKLIEDKVREGDQQDEDARMDPEPTRGDVAPAPHRDKQAAE